MAQAFNLDRKAQAEKAVSLMLACASYDRAIRSGANPNDCAEWVDLLRTGFEMFGCDELHAAWQEARAPDFDLFGNIVPSRAASAAEIGWAEGKAA